MGLCAVDGVLERRGEVAGVIIPVQDVPLIPCDPIKARQSQQADRRRANYASGAHSENVLTGGIGAARCIIRDCFHEIGAETNLIEALRCAKDNGELVRQCHVTNQRHSPQTRVPPSIGMRSAAISTASGSRRASMLKTWRVEVQSQSRHAAHMRRPEVSIRRPRVRTSHRKDLDAVLVRQHNALVATCAAAFMALDKVLSVVGAVLDQELPLDVINDAVNEYNSLAARD